MVNHILKAKLLFYAKNESFLKTPTGYDDMTWYNSIMSTVATYNFKRFQNIHKICVAYWRKI